MTFRRKLYLSYFIVFLIFLALLFPFASRVVTSIVRKTLTTHTEQMIALAETAPTIPAMISRLQERQPYLFFRVSLIDPSGKILYDSHAQTERIAQEPASYLKEHPEIGEALRGEAGYSEGYSYVLAQSLAYVAQAFNFHGQTLVMRTSFPLLQITELTRDFEIGFLFLGVIVLLLFSLMTALIAFHLSRPIQSIISAIRPYQEGVIDRIPEIEIGKRTRRPDDFGRLAITLNSLTRKIESQLDALRAERNEKEAVLESLIEGVIAVDAKMAITDVNRTALQMLRMKREELVGHQFIVTGHQEFHDLLVACQQKHEPVTMTTQLGERKLLFLDVIAVPKEIEQGAVLIMQDKSVYYRVIEMKKDFIANASHELKTPVTIVRGFAEALHDHPDMETEMIQSITEKMIRNCDRMENLVRNFLRLADIENLPRGNLQRCDLLKLVNLCKQTLLSVYPNAEVEVEKIPEQNLIILADPDLLELAINNLFDNAAKYSKAPAKIRVVLNELAGKDKVKITVSDQGIGIPAEDLEHVFQRFYTVDKARSRQLGGSGLGLSIVQTIIDKHFGSITVDSELGKGTTFTIILPINMEQFTA
jgi:two-component system, OmpR family, phosphate regulon sensor histidine kinase PhoR